MLVLLGLVMTAALGAVAVLLRRRTGAASDDQPLVFSGRLSVSDGPQRRGRLRLSASRAVWRSGLRAPVDLSGAVLLGAAMRRVRHRRGDGELRLLLGNGTSALLELPEAQAAATARMLTGRDVPGLDASRIRPAGSTWWAVACLAVSGLWMALMAVTAFDGYSAAATVVRSGGGWTCTVTWVDPNGARQSDESDCFDEPVGSSLQIQVPWGDFRGAVTTRPMLGFVALAGATPLAAVGALRLRVLARRRRTSSALIRMMADQAAATAAAGGPASSVAGTHTALIRLRRRAWGVLALGTVALVAVSSLFMIMDAADRDLRARGVTTVGTVVTVHPDRKWSPGGADVRFQGSGDVATRYVRLGSDADGYDAGQRVDVLYDPAAPDRFTIDDISYEPPWTTWPSLISLGVAMFGMPTGIWMVRVRRTTARVLATGPWAPVHVRVRVDDKRLFLTTEDGATWRSTTLDREWSQARRSDWRARWLSRPALPDDQRAPAGPGDDAHEVSPPDHSADPLAAPELAWWVRDGELAVFSPNPAERLVLARLG